MGLAATKKKPPTDTPSNPPSAHLDGGEVSFFRHLAKVAGITRKEIQYDLRVSKTLVDCWMEGSKHDPLRRARDTVAMFIRKGQAGLLPAILVYIAGGEEFDGAVLTAAQTDALRQLGRAVDRPGK